MRALTARAQARGAATVVMDVLAGNRRVLTMIADHWPAAQYDHSAAYVTIHAPLPRYERDEEERPSEGLLSAR